MAQTELVEPMRQAVLKTAVAAASARVCLDGALSHVAMMRAHSGLLISRLHMAKQLMKMPEGSLDLLDDIERIDRFLTSIHGRVEALTQGREIPG
jgi:hypothetical protein